MKYQEITIKKIIFMCFKTLLYTWERHHMIEEIWFSQTTWHYLAEDLPPGMTTMWSGTAFPDFGFQVHHFSTLTWQNNVEMIKCFPGIVNLFQRNDIHYCKNLFLMLLIYIFREYSENQLQLIYQNSKNNLRTWYYKSLFLKPNVLVIIGCKIS